MPDNKPQSNQPGEFQLLHVIDRIGAGGPARSLLSLVKHAPQRHRGIEHSVLALDEAAYPPLIFAARKLGCNLLRAPGREETRRLVEATDAVLLHFWNTPLVWQYLATAPAARTIIWSKVLGSALPQTINPLLEERASRLVLTARPPETMLPDRAPSDGDIEVVPGLADFDRVEGVTPKPHSGFNVDYVGTLTKGKLHPGFVDMMDRVEIPQLSVRIFGGSPEPWLSQQVGDARDPVRFRFGGFVEDLAAVFATSDVFGYPLAEDTYATSDKALQEAMYAGVPPVILPHGGPADFVENGKTGIVAASAEEFTQAINWLFQHPEKRKHMGFNAREAARLRFRPDLQAGRLLDIVTGAGSAPRTTMLDTSEPADPAALFLLSHGWTVEAAYIAARNWIEDRGGEVDRWILALPRDAVQIEGGLFHWHRHFPDHPAIRWWSMLQLAVQDRRRDALKMLRHIGAEQAVTPRQHKLSDRIARILRQDDCAVGEIELRRELERLLAGSSS